MFEKNPWLIFDREPMQDDFILFCLHFAGGNAAVFREWQKYAPPGIVICRIQLPGHGTRMEEKLMTNLSSILDELQNAIQPWLNHSYAFLGHSMGGSIAAEWTIRLQDERLSLPQYLFISASEPTHKKWRPSCHNLSKEEFLAFVFNNGGTNKEVLEHKELMEIFEPILRADYTVLETWAPRSVRPIYVPIIVFASHEDRVVPSEVVSEWKLFAASSWEMKLIYGDHFFIQTHPSLVRNYVFKNINTQL